MAEEAKQDVLRRIESAGKAVKKAMMEGLKKGLRTKVLFTIQLSQPTMEVDVTESFVDDDAAPNAFTDAENEAYNVMVQGIVYSTDLSVTEARIAARMQLTQLKKQGLLIHSMEVHDAESAG